MADKITITINNKEYKVDPDQTIMQAADKLGFHIPRLCYHPKLSIEGSCRVCIVEVEGARNYVASCSFPVTDGMKIHTNTQALRKARRDIVELILDNHPEDCHTCERDGNCELQRLAASMPSIWGILVSSNIRSNRFNEASYIAERPVSARVTFQPLSINVLISNC